jgi:hypothetical protein
VAPTKLFVAVDGPRLGDEFADECRLIEQTKAVIEKEIDWDCELKLLYREKNLGCAIGVSSAITWFFENVEEGIILEDDCIPGTDFFNFVSEMLVRYRDNEQIMHITGNNFNRGNNFNNYSYYFSNYNHMWGWASWARAWKHYDDSENYWLKLKNTDFLNNYLGDKIEARFWSKYFDEIFILRVLDTWDYVWRLNMWEKGGLAISPNFNLVTNIGFDDLATHSKNGNPTPIVKMKFPLIHPAKIERNKKTDSWTFKKQIAEIYSIKYNFQNRVIRKLKNILFEF